MPNATLTTTLLVQPSVADGSFPVGASSVPITLTPSPKPLVVDTGVMKRNLASPAAYVTLSGVGATDTVTQGSFLYLRTNAPMLLRLTTFNPAGASVVSVFPVLGLFVTEFDPSRYLTLVEIQGTGVVEYLAGGLL